ncbi:DUF3958 family protein [Bacillus manliponensis]|uniref:DUF3958 family protein n=1 Tax=Bacillus manliponensis TaxID=574376 RepID=UPI0035162F03
MNCDTEQKMNELNNKLQTISEEQRHNQLAIQKQEQKELVLDQVRNQGRRVFDRVLETWYKDKELGRSFLDMRQDVQHTERKLTLELENEKEALRQEKKRLEDQEHELYYERQKLSSEVKS